MAFKKLLQGNFRHLILVSKCRHPYPSLSCLPPPPPHPYYLDEKESPLSLLPWGLYCSIKAKEGVEFPSLEVFKRHVAAKGHDLAVVLAVQGGTQSLASFPV